MEYYSKQKPQILKLLKNFRFVKLQKSETKK